MPPASPGVALQATRQSGSRACRRSAHSTRGEAAHLFRLESGDPRSLRPSLSCPNPLEGMGENGGPEIGSDLSGSWRPGSHRRCPDSLFTALRCDAGIFLPLIKRQTSPSSSLLKNHKYPSRFEWEKARPFLSLRLHSQLLLRLGTLGDYPRVPCKGWGSVGPSRDSLGTVL